MRGLPRGAELLAEDDAATSQYGLAVGFDGTVLPDDVHELADTTGLGGVVLFTRNCPDPSLSTAVIVGALAALVLDGPTSPVDVLLIDDANPVFLSPRSWRMREALDAGRR